MNLFTHPKTASSAQSFATARRSSAPIATRFVRPKGVACWLALLTLFGLAREAFATPSEQAVASAQDGDSFELFLDRSVGQRAASTQDGSGAILVGVEATMFWSPKGASTFGLMGFLTVPLERITKPMSRAPNNEGAHDVVAPALAPSFAEGPKARGHRATSTAAETKATDAQGPTRKQDATKETTEGTATPKPADNFERPTISGDLIVFKISSEIARGAVQAACKEARLDEADARLDGLASAAKKSALLPELRLRATRAIDESESLAPTEYDPSRRTASGGTSTWLEARATFRLDRIVFADDEIAIEKLRITRAAERSKLTAKVLAALSAWQRDRATELDPSAKSDARLASALGRMANEATLDVLTGGWFSKAILSIAKSERSRDQKPPPENPNVPDNKTAQTAPQLTTFDATHPSEQTADKSPQK